MTKAKIILFAVLKWVSVLLAAVFIGSLLFKGHVSGAAIEDVAAAVTGVSDLSNMQEGDNQMIKRLYGLDPGSYDGVILYYPTTNMGAEEILIVKLKSIDQQDEVRNAAQARVDDQIGVFEGYGVEQTEMLQQAVIDVRGNYVMLVVAGDTAPAVSAFEKAL